MEYALHRCSSAVLGRGLNDVADEIDALTGNADLLQIETALEKIESRTLRALAATLTDEQRSTIRESAASDFACMGGPDKFTMDEGAALKAKFFARHARALLNLPRISLIEYMG